MTESQKTTTKISKERVEAANKIVEKFKQYKSAQARLRRKRISLQAAILDFPGADEMTAERLCDVIDAGSLRDVHHALKVAGDRDGVTQASTFSGGDTDAA